MNFPFAPPPEEDSPDLTDEEILKSLTTSRVEDIEEGVKGHACPTCAATAFAKAEHELRRRIPTLYWRIRFTCGQGHVSLMTFKVGWLNRR